MKRNKQILMLTVAFVFISFFSAGALWAMSHEIVTKEVRYHKQLKDVKGFLARPAGNKKYPAIVLIHELPPVGGEVGALDVGFSIRTA